MPTPDLFSWQPLKRYPEVPGFKRRGTSERAAKKAAIRAGTDKANILALLARPEHATGLLPDEACKILDGNQITFRARFTDLKGLGYLEETGAQRLNDSGTEAYVCRITEQGKNAIVWVAT